jgi:hypothetical protein
MAHHTTPTRRPASAPAPRDGYGRLAWAGVELRWGAHRVRIDPPENVDRLAGFLTGHRDGH